MDDTTITENGFLTVDTKDLTFRKNLTLSQNSTLTITNYYLYNNDSNNDGSTMPYLKGSAAYNDPVITVAGSILFDSINLVIEFKEPTNLYNNISIVLVELLQDSTFSNQINITNIHSSNIQLINVLNIDDIQPKINFVVQDYTIRLEFDHGNENGPNNGQKWKIAFIVCAIVAGVFAIAFVVVLFMKKRLSKFNGEHQRLINTTRA
ncbi:expressed protein [Dictyostelium purpureum]|uniref:Expressed protein n=1 Tax=Dictyostelium purpureum TaxID=5786 RepID=F0ZQW7_DICPU|nr:uncharacterized protein DICPUDRAFT_72772 [Dictyostelium purpureum]EGC33651.1 expressed protein [Dictyostelium purpureum]|eukprot:XP_003289821.1 expressed protein [Dictyostelium purpureum]